MVIDTHLVENLKQFGLNSYQAKLWLALLSRGIATAGELSDISNVPRSRAYDVLESLEKKGFIIMKIGKPIKYIAVPPSEVIKRVQKRVKEEAKREAEQLEVLRLSEVMSELMFLHSNGVEKIDPTELAAFIKGRNNLYDHIASMLDNAQKSVIINTTAQGFVRKSEILKKSFKKLKKKGVKIKVAVPASKNLQKHLDDIKKFGDIRQSNINSRFVITDSEQMVFMLVNDADVNSSYDSGITINSGFFVKSFESLFDQNWSKMKKF